MWVRCTNTSIANKSLPTESGEASRATRCPPMPDISTDQQAVGGNQVSGLSHVHRPLGEVISRLFCQSHAAGKISLEVENIRLHVGDHIQKALHLISRADVR